MTNPTSKYDGPAILIEGVVRSFGGKPILRGVSGSVAAGRVVGLLGRNGEGKTTLLRILLDLLASNSGWVEVLGLIPDGSGRIRQRVGYVPERPAFHDFMTVGEVLGLRSRFFGSWDVDRAAALCKELGLDPRTRVQGASKGTLGKTAWVCAAAHSPELFLLDEPTSGLDALIREDVLEHLIQELHESGKTILVANHRMEELAGVLDEVWVLAGGTVQAVHDVEALRTQARRITGRPKAGIRLPRELAAARLPSEGPLVEWITLDRQSTDRILRSGFLEGAQSSPVPLEETFKFLLREEGE